MKASCLSRYVKGTLRNMPNVVGNFVACTKGFYGEFKVWPSGSNMETSLDLQMLFNHCNAGESSTKIDLDHANVKPRVDHIMPCKKGDNPHLV